MITYAEELYLSEKIKEKNNKKPYVDEIKVNVTIRKGMFSIYFISIAANGKDVFDIFPAYCFKQKKFTDEDIFIVGITDSMESSYEFVKEMTENYLASDSKLSMRDYYIEKFKLK